MGICILKRKRSGVVVNGGGQSNDGANVGAGAGVYRDKTGATLNLRTLTGKGGLAVSVNGDEVDIDASGIVANPGGSDTQGQYNDGGTFAGASQWRYVKATGQTLIGSTASSADFPNTKLVASQTSVTTSPDNAPMGIAAEAQSGSSAIAKAVLGTAKSSSTLPAYGVEGIGLPESIGSGVDAVGGNFAAIKSHSGGRNIAAKFSANGGSDNIAILVDNGDIDCSTNNAIFRLKNGLFEALNFRIGGSGHDLLKFNTASGSEAVEIDQLNTNDIRGNTTETLIMRSGSGQKLQLISNFAATGDSGDVSIGVGEAPSGTPGKAYFSVAGSERLRLTDSGLSFNGETPIARPTVTGSKGGNAALASLISALDQLGLITDSTT